MSTATPRNREAITLSVRRRWPDTGQRKAEQLAALVTGASPARLRHVVALVHRDEPSALLVLDEPDHRRVAAAQRAGELLLVASGEELNRLIDPAVSPVSPL